MNPYKLIKQTVEAVGGELLTIQPTGERALVVIELNGNVISIEVVLTRRGA